LQPFFFGICLPKVRIDPKHDVDVISGYFPPLDQGADSVAFLSPISLSEASMYLHGEVFQTANNQRQCCLEGVGIDALLPRLLRLGETAPQAEDTGLKLRRVNEAVRITVNEPREPWAQFAQVGFHRCTCRVLCRRLWLQPTPVCLRKALRVGKQRRDLAPHGHIEQIRPHLGLLTEPLPAKAIRIRPQAAGIGVRPRLSFPRTRAQAFPIVGIATVLTLDHALEHREGTPLGLPRMTAILLPLCLDRGKHLGVYKRGNWDSKPVFWGAIHG